MAISTNANSNIYENPEIKRRRKLAEALKGMSTNVNPMANPTTTFLTSLLGSAIGNYQEDKASALEEQRRQQYNQLLSQALKKSGETGNYSSAVDILSGSDMTQPLASQFLMKDIENKQSIAQEEAKRQTALDDFITKEKLKQQLDPLADLRKQKMQAEIGALGGGAGDMSMNVGGVNIPVRGDVKTFKRELAKKQAENINKYNELVSAVPQIEQMVNELDDLAKKATYTKAGKFKDILFKEAGLGATEGAIAKTSYEAKILNEVLPRLKSVLGGQFTEEDRKQFQKTLGDVNMTPEEKNSALKAYLNQRKNEIKTLSSQLGIEQQSSNSMPITQENPPSGADDILNLFGVE